MGGTLRSGLNGAAAPMPTPAPSDPITRTPVMPEGETAPRGTHRVVAPPPAPEPVSLRPIPEPQTAAETPAAPAPSNSALEDRVAQLEARLEQQEAALRRVLTLLVDWTEIDNRGDARREAAATIRTGAWGHAA
jgi:hypothetical protein